MDNTKRQELKRRHEAIKAARAARRDLDKVIRCAAGAVFTQPEIARQRALVEAAVR